MIITQFILFTIKNTICIKFIPLIIFWISHSSDWHCLTVSIPSLSKSKKSPDYSISSIHHKLIRNRRANLQKPNPATKIICDINPPHLFKCRQNITLPDSPSLPLFSDDPNNISNLPTQFPNTTPPITLCIEIVSLVFINIKIKQEPLSTFQKHIHPIQLLPQKLAKQQLFTINFNGHTPFSRCLLYTYSI